MAFKRNRSLWLWAIFLSLLALRIYSNALANLSPYNTYTALIINGFVYGAIVIPLVVGIYLLIMHGTRWHLLLAAFLAALLVVCQFKILKANYIVLAFALSFYSPEEITLMYRRSLGLTFVLAYVSGLFVHNTRSFIDGVYSFGFYNENQTGFVITLLAILMTVKITEKSVTLNLNRKNEAFLLLVFLIVSFYFKDRTAELMIIAYVLLIWGRRLFKSRLFQFFVGAFPLLLAWAAYYCGMNYGIKPFLFIVNKLSTSRLLMWHYYFMHQPLTLQGNRINVIKGWGLFYTPGQGMFDGSYAYMLFFYGLIFSIVLFIGLALANFKLAWSGNYMLAIIMMVIEISGFTENQMVSVMISFAAIFALIAYMPKWIHRADKDVLNEQ